MNFDYKKYSLEQLDNWMHDAISGDASPDEIYECITNVVREQYYYHKQQTSRAYELLSKLNARCDAAEEKHSKHYYDYTRNDLNRKNPFDKTLTYDEAKDAGWEMTADGFWLPPQEKDKVKKWVLPVEEAKDADTDETDYFVSFPDDLLEATDLKEGDQVEWVDNNDGSYTLTKVTKSTDD